MAGLTEDTCIGTYYSRLFSEAHVVTTVVLWTHAIFSTRVLPSIVISGIWSALLEAGFRCASTLFVAFSSGYERLGPRRKNE